MESFIDKIRPELLLIAIVLYFIGIALKKSKLKDNYIPIILGTIGIVVGIVYIGLFEGWSYQSCITGFVQGFLCAGCSVYGNQVIKQFLKLHKVDDNLADTIADSITGKKDD